MKKLTFVATTILALGLTTSNLQAKEASTEENVGFFTGALAGAAIGGPIGFIIGGVSGVLMGEQVNQANQVEGLKMSIQEQQNLNSSLNQDLNSLQASIHHTNELLAIKTDFITQELTLNMMFNSNSSELADSDMNLVNRVSSILTDFPELNIQLDGYADPVGSKKDNLNLSMERTTNVKNAFESLGVSPDRIMTNAHGESLTSIDLQDTDSYALERKVSISFYIDHEQASAQTTNQVIDTSDDVTEVKLSEDDDVLAIN